MHCVAYSIFINSKYKYIERSITTNVEKNTKRLFIGVEHNIYYYIYCILYNI